MKKNQNNIREYLLEHSQAKVKLYGDYLSVYINILSYAPSVDEILIFDLLCGEGLYKNDLKGSPLIALDRANDHFAQNINSGLQKI